MSDINFEKLRAIVGEANVLRDPADLYVYGPIERPQGPQASCAQ